MPNINFQKPSLLTCDPMLSYMPTILTMPLHFHRTLRYYELFTGTQVQDNSNNWHPFCCPNYVLNESLYSSQQIHHRWKTRSKVGMYLGRYPLHNHDIALVFNWDSVLVSPQFHVRYDHLFTTTKYFDFSSLWQIRGGFFSMNRTHPQSL